MAPSASLHLTTSRTIHSYKSERGLTLEGTVTFENYQNKSPPLEGKAFVLSGIKPVLLANGILQKLWAVDLAFPCDCIEPVRKGTASENGFLVREKLPYAVNLKNLCIFLILLRGNL